MPFSRRRKDIIKCIPQWKENCPNFDIDLELYDILEDSLPNDLLFIPLVPYIKIAMTTFLDVKSIRGNAAHMPTWYITKEGLIDFDYHGIIKTINETPDYGLPDKMEIIAKFKEGVRTRNIDKLLK